jgi:hypothetical protein
MSPMYHRDITGSEMSLLAVHGCFSVDLREDVAAHHRLLVVRDSAVCVIRVQALHVKALKSPSAGM